MLTHKLETKETGGSVSFGNTHTCGTFESILFKFYVKHVRMALTEIKFAHSLPPQYQLTPWSTVFIEKPLLAQLVNKFLAFYRSWKLTTVFTRSHQMTLSSSRWIQYKISLRNILVLFSKLSLHLPNSRNCLLALFTSSWSRFLDLSRSGATFFFCDSEAARL